MHQRTLKIEKSLINPLVFQMWASKGLWYIDLFLLFISPTLIFLLVWLNLCGETQSVVDSPHNMWEHLLKCYPTRHCFYKHVLLRSRRHAAFCDVRPTFWDANYKPTDCHPRGTWLTAGLSCRAASRNWIDQGLPTPQQNPEEKTVLQRSLTVPRHQQAWAGSDVTRRFENRALMTSQVGVST